MRKAIRDIGARLVFLPKYSPDLNPIEQVFAKFKTLLRKVGARSYEAISDACAEILAQYPPAECAAYLKTQDTRRPKSRTLLRDGVEEWPVCAEQVIDLVDHGVEEAHFYRAPHRPAGEARPWLRREKRVAGYGLVAAAGRSPSATQPTSTAITG